jgi:hypothetical protein
MLILKNKNKEGNNIEYRLVNEERGVKLDIKPLQDPNEINPILNSPLGGVNIHKTGKAIWV